jgi:hypothetical protein
MIPTWAERCENFEDGEIVTNAKIQQAMQEEIDDLRKELALQRLSDIGQAIERDLTDEEITEIGLAHGAFFTESKHYLWGDDLEIHDFARAILKKVKEK